MLARVANSLYWTGRYIERSEHLARYIKVQYFSNFDSPITQNKNLVLQSILSMSSEAPVSEREGDAVLNEQDILVEVAFNGENSNSILSSVRAARENARSVRYAISSELWQVINRYYHFANEYSVDYYKTRGLYDFTTRFIEHCSIIRSYMDSTLLHDDIWAFIKLGINIERAAQIVRIISNKIHDIHVLTADRRDAPLVAFQWTTTLKIAECFDMFKKRHKNVPSERNVLRFLLTNTALPRSVAFALAEMNALIGQLSTSFEADTPLSFYAAKLANAFRFLEIEEIEDDIPGFLGESLGKIYELNDLIHEEYFA